MSDKFSLHPVVTLVVWLLGGKTLRHNESSVTWKDEHGGDIAEVMHEKIEFTDVYGIRANDDFDGSGEKIHQKVIPDNTVNNENELSNNATAGEGDGGWDWYVAITPPKQEFYPKGQSTKQPVTPIPPKN